MLRTSLLTALLTLCSFTATPLINAIPGASTIAAPSRQPSAAIAATGVSTYAQLRAYHLGESTIRLLSRNSPPNHRWRHDTSYNRHTLQSATRYQLEALRYRRPGTVYWYPERTSSPLARPRVPHRRLPQSKVATSNIHTEVRQFRSLPRNRMAKRPGIIVRHPQFP